MQKIKENFRRINKKEAKASFYIVENLCYCYIKGVWGVAPMQVVSRWCRCIVQRLCATDCKRPCLVRAAAPHSPPARMPCVYAQGLCKDAKPTKHTQPFTGKGVFGKDAEIRTHQALHEAKPSECPKGDRDNKSEVYFKKRLFYNLRCRFCDTF